MNILEHILMNTDTPIYWVYPGIELCSHEVCIMDVTKIFQSDCKNIHSQQQGEFWELHVLNNN